MQSQDQQSYIYIVDYQIPLNQYLTLSIKIIGALKTNQSCRHAAHKQDQVSTSLKYKCYFVGPLIERISELYETLLTCML